MEEEFRKWLIRRGKKGAAINYPSAIHRISEHYSSNTGESVNIYQLTDQKKISQIAHDYKKNGKFSEFGYEHHGLYRAAISRYSEFFASRNTDDELNDIAQEEIGTDISSSEEINFAYERDLQTTLCSQISELFPSYQIFGNNNQGIEYVIENRRIDVLLEHSGNGSLLAVELKSGLADYKVFGQLSMYIGLLQAKFPNTQVNGVIVAGSIDDSLRQACAITEKIALKVYRMSLELEDA